jgi:putative oxidoreductase
MESERYGTSGVTGGGIDAIAARTSDLVLLVGRVLLGLIFVESGFGKLMNMSGFVATMPKRGLPDFLGYVAPPVEFLGGLAILLGLASRWAALLILLFTIVATFSTHRYWTYPAEQVTGQKINFFKNVSMMGGLLIFFVAGAGRYAIDAFRKR